MIKKIGYNVILDECKDRTEYSRFNLDRYIKMYSEWDKFLVRRHKKILQKYIDSEYNLAEFSDMINCSIRDASSILLRIEMQFKIYSELSNKNVVFVENDEEFESIVIEKIKKENKAKVFKSCGKFKEIKYDYLDILKQDKVIDEKARKISKGLNRYNEAVKAARLKKFRKTVEKLKKFKFKEQVFTGKMLLYVEDLINGLSIDDICSKYNIQYKYASTIIIGHSNGKKKQNKGFLKLMQEYEKQNKVK